MYILYSVIINQVIPVRVDFSFPVVVVVGTGASPPRLPLGGFDHDGGASKVYAEFVEGSGTSRLLFEYTVREEWKSRRSLANPSAGFAARPGLMLLCSADWVYSNLGGRLKSVTCCCRSSNSEFCRKATSHGRDTRRLRKHCCDKSYNILYSSIHLYKPGE